jgi:hypothetical protein
MGLHYLLPLENPKSSFIRGDSGGKGSILGGYTIGHYEEKSSYEHMSDYEL